MAGMTGLAPLLARIGWDAATLARRLPCSPSYAHKLATSEARNATVEAWLDRLAAAVEAETPPVRSEWQRPRFGRVA